MDIVVQHDPSRTYFPLLEVGGDLTQKFTGAELGLTEFSSALHAKACPQ